MTVATLQSEFSSRQIKPLRLKYETDIVNRSFGCELIDCSCVKNNIVPSFRAVGYRSFVKKNSSVSLKIYEILM